MSKKNYFKALDFKTPEQYFEYIIDSKINGNYSQVVALIKDMPKKSIGLFLKWSQSDPHNDHYKHCINKAIEILSGTA
jgi:hypothetical protein